MRNWLWGDHREARELAQPRSLVQVLRNDEELRSALERAIESERATASRATELISRYEQMEPRDALVSMPARSSDSNRPTQERAV